MQNRIDAFHKRLFGYLPILVLAVSNLLEAAYEDWPGFRGPNHDGSAASGSKLTTSGGGRLNVVWRSVIGPGYSAVSVAEGRAVTMYSDGNSDMAVAFDMKTGKELWRYTIGNTYKGHDGSHDGPIATPAIAGGRVFGLDAWGKLFALDFSSGKEIWTVDVGKSVGEKRKPFYGFGTSPLVVGGVLIVETGEEGNRAITGFDPATGSVKWTLGEDTVNYQSPILLKWNGKEQVVAVGDTKLFGVDPSEGSVLWEYVYEGEERAMARETLVPIPAGEGYLFLKNKQDSSAMVRLTSGTDGKVKVESVWTAPVLKATYSLALYHDGYLYGYNGRTVLTCVDAKTGELKWRSREPGDGFLMLVDGNLVIQAKEGSLHIGPASPEGWKETARIDLFGKVSWSNPSFADGAIFSRGMGEIARIEWSSAQAAEKPAVKILGAPPVTSGFAKFLKEVETAPDKNAAVDQFIATVPSFPFIEWPDQVHFLYRGPADDMGIAGDMIGERREDPMLRVPGTDLFYYSIRLEPDAGINYRFIKNYDEKLTDPRNNLTFKDSRGEFSWLGMPGWEGSPDYLKEAPEGRHGRIETHELNIKSREGTSAKFAVYLPAGYDKTTDRYPVAILFGGEEARTSGLVPVTLDNLIGVTVKPLIAVFIDDVSYGPKPPETDAEDLNTYAAIVANEIVPFVDANYRTIREVTSRAAMGTGSPGFYALFTTFKNPGLFGYLAVQSLFLFDSDMPTLKKELRTVQEQPLSIYHDWGLYDLRAVREGWDLAKSNREFNASLRELGYKPAGGETHQGSGWDSWRNRTEIWLMAFFPMKK